jgi:cell division protein FtsL
MVTACPWQLVCLFGVIFVCAFADMTSARKIVDEKRRLEREEEAAEDELINLQAESTRIHNEMNAQFAKITRLRRQRRQVEVRGMDMIQRGLNSMDELERAEQSEQAALENAMADGTFQDWSAAAEQSEWDSLGLGAFIDHSSGSGVGGSSSGVVGH